MYKILLVEFRPRDASVAADGVHQPYIFVEKVAGHSALCLCRNGATANGEQTQADDGDYGVDYQ